MRTLDKTSTSPALVKRESIIERVLQTVAAYENVPTTELPPLFEVVDPDALAALFASPPGSPTRTRGMVTFPYSGYLLTVSADGSVDAEPVHRASGDGQI